MGLEVKRLVTYWAGNDHAAPNAVMLQEALSHHRRIYTAPFVQLNVVASSALVNYCLENQLPEG
jgi:hypothetical protein